jgi:hypothetical protein
MAEALQMLESQVDWTEQLMTPYLKASKPVDHNGGMTKRRCDENCTLIISDD